MGTAARAHARPAAVERLSKRLGQPEPVLGLDSEDPCKKEIQKVTGAADARQQKHHPSLSPSRGRVSLIQGLMHSTTRSGCKGPRFHMQRDLTQVWDTGAWGRKRGTHLELITFSSKAANTIYM